MEENDFSIYQNATKKMIDKERKQRFTSLTAPFILSYFPSDRLAANLVHQTFSFLYLGIIFITPPRSLDSFSYISYSLSFFSCIHIVFFVKLWHIVASIEPYLRTESSFRSNYREKLKSILVLYVGDSCWIHGIWHELTCVKIDSCQN